MTIEDFFAEHPRVALAFSGGVDSSYLLYEAARHCEKLCAYYVNAQFQPSFELTDAVRIAASLNAEMKIIPLDVLACAQVTDNPPDRCYYCKQLIFEEIRKAAAADGFEVLLDGTNASDDEGDRPGMRALKELAVLSPLRLCGLTKEEIRARARAAGLFVWDKPAYACLATRIPAGMHITRDRLEATERAESALFDMGFTDFRVRMQPGGGALLQIRQEEGVMLLEKHEQILNTLLKWYPSVALDLHTR